MGTSIKPLACTGHCSNCYENGIRKNYTKKPNYLEMENELLARIDRIKKNGENTPGLHGGEPLLMPLKNVENFLDIVFQSFKKTNIQTDGLLITEKHIELFKKYNTYVGISLDGHTGTLNRGRWDSGNTTLEQSEKNTKKIINIIKKMIGENIQIGIISVLRNVNVGTPEKLNGFIEFLDLLKEMGIKYIRTNPVIGYDKPEDELTPKRLAEVWSRITDYYLENPELQIYPAIDFLKAASGQKNVVCSLSECDPYKTQAENTITDDGSSGICLKTGAGKDGIQALRSETGSNIRSEILQAIPQSELGCKDCEYWNQCKGGCPGEGINDDWRNRSRFCEAYKIMSGKSKKIIKALEPIGCVADPGNNGTQKRVYQDSSHGDGYADSNRPWTLADPRNNRAKAIDYRSGTVKHNAGGKK